MAGTLRGPLLRAPAAATDARAGKYLTFDLAGEEFGVRVLKVREIMGLQEITPVPQTASHVKGVINLRGNVVPVVDMRLKFGMPATEKGVNTCIIIVEVTVDDETTVLGALAYSVREVLDLEPEQIEQAPRIGTRLNIDFIRGMGKHGDGFVMILNINKVFSADELAACEPGAAAA